MTARILIIAGSDSGGGAGIQADIKTVTMLGGHAMTAITAITAQNTLGVQAISLVEPEMVAEQMTAVIDDIGVDAIKIGMVPSAECAAIMGSILLAARDRLTAIHGERARYPVPVVLDPVLVATSGDRLVSNDVVDAMRVHLFPFVSLITPNVPELEALGGVESLLAHGCALLEKGGHRDGAMLLDRLYPNDPAQPETLDWEAPRIDTTSTHGTGCTLASAVATSLGQGLPLVAAVARARDFVRLALHNAPGLGQGHGPMGHQAVRNDGLFTGPALNQITLPASDYAASVAFYKLLGLTQIVDAPDNGYARFEAANGGTLSIHVGTGIAGSAVTYLESGALDAWCAYLSRKGVRIDQYPRDEEWGWREARLSDPAGNTLCLYQGAEYRRFPPWRIDQN